jgi:tetratricopeptide (TPR) repeat protein
MNRDLRTGAASARDAAIVNALKAAVSAIGAGDLEEAARVLRAESNALRTPVGQNILGDVYLKQGKPKEALKAFDVALRLAPNMPEAYCNRSVALQEIGRLDDALSAVDRALRLRPQYATAHYNRGNVLKAQHRLVEAEEAYNKALGLQPAFPEALLNRGLARLPIGKRMEALADFNKALAYRQNYAAAHVGRAEVFRSLNDIQQAFSAIDAALVLDPESTDAKLIRIDVLLSAERNDEACESAKAILETAPDNGKALSAYSRALSALKQFDEALVVADQAVALMPEDPNPHIARGMVLNQLDRAEESLVSLDIAQRLGAWGAGYLQARATTLAIIGRADEADDCFGQALAFEPDNATIRYNRAFFLLGFGRFEEGWAEHEWRLKKHDYGAIERTKLAPRWQGEDLAGKKLLIYAEQGHGDSIQFTRYVPMVVQRGGEITLLVQEALRRLYEANFPGLDVTGELGMRTGYDYQVSLMSLPYVLRDSQPTIPGDIPYLWADPTRTAKWRERLGDHGFKIGIAWQGNPKYGGDRFRSIALKQFAPIAKVPGVRLISLQWTGGADQLDGIRNTMQVETLGEEIVNNPDGFREVAAVMANLDLLITSDTGPAHLAGALGRPIWVALAKRPDWRWMREGTTTPWYSTMRLFRQRTSRDWDGVFEEITEELGRLVASREADKAGAL